MSDGPDFGLYISCADDIDPIMREVNGFDALAQALARRLDTPRGTLIDDPDYGYDLAQLVSRGMTADELAAIPSSISDEFQKDECVASVETKVLFYSTGVLKLTFHVRAADGPFRFTVEIADARALVLDIQPGEAA